VLFAALAASALHARRACHSHQHAGGRRSIYPSAKRYTNVKLVFFDIIVFSHALQKSLNKHPGGCSLANESQAIRGRFIEV
jgi:hypothetical protein